MPKRRLVAQRPFGDQRRVRPCAAPRRRRVAAAISLATRATSAADALYRDRRAAGAGCSDLRAAGLRQVIRANQSWPRSARSVTTRSARRGASTSARDRRPANNLATVRRDQLCRPAEAQSAGPDATMWSISASSSRKLATRNQRRAIKLDARKPDGSGLQAVMNPHRPRKPVDD